MLLYKHNTFVFDEKRDLECFILDIQLVHSCLGIGRPKNASSIRNLSLRLLDCGIKPLRENYYRDWNWALGLLPGRMGGLRWVGVDLMLILDDNLEYANCRKSYRD